MAKFNSSTFNQLSGKVGGQVFRTGKGGMMVSGKSAPIRKRTYDNTTWGNRVSFVSSFWRTLTDSQRTTWYEVAGSKLSAFQLFCKLNLNRLGANEYVTTGTLLTVPPMVSIIGIAPSVYTIQANGIKRIQILTTGVNIADWSLQVQSSFAQSRGFTRTSNVRFRQIQNFNNPISGTYTFTANFNFYIGTLAGRTGQKVVIRVRAFHRAYGYTTPWIHSLVTIS